MQYLLRWKMHTALKWLKESDAPLGQLANKLGYESEAAFSRAFNPDDGHEFHPNVSDVGYNPGPIWTPASLPIAVVD